MVESFSPGCISRMGFGWDVVHALNPRLIMASVSAFGQSGPLAKVPGFDYMAASYAGVISMIGEPDGPPYFYMLGIGDVMTGVHATAAISSALYHREKTGRGVQIEVSLLDSYFHCHEVNVACHSASEGAINPTRCGRHHWAVAPLGIYKCNEGYLFVAALPAQWPAFCTGLGVPELITDPRFVDNVARLENGDALNAIIEQRLARWTNALEAADGTGRALSCAGGPGAVGGGGDAPSAPNRARGGAHSQRSGVRGRAGARDAAALCWLSAPSAPDHPYLGQHNVEVLTQYGRPQRGRGSRASNAPAPSSRSRTFEPAQASASSGA